MTTIYIVLYLVVGLIVKWLCERKNPSMFVGEEIVELYALMFWPLVLLIICFGYILKYMHDDAINPYTRIRKFFRGF